MQTCSSLSSSAICRSFAKHNKPDSRRRTKLRLVGGNSARLHTYHTAVTSVLTMSSASCSAPFGSVKSKVSAKKRVGSRGRGNGNKKASVRNINANIIIPACQASNSECLPTNVSCASVTSQSLPTLQSAFDNATLMLEPLSVNRSSDVSELPEIAAEASSVITKQTRRRKSSSKTRPSAAETLGRTATQKSRGGRAAGQTGRSTAVKRRRRCTSTTVNDKFIKSMTMFVSQVARSMVAACVEQTFTQLSQQGIFFSPYAASLSVNNGAVSLLNQHSAVATSSADQTCHFRQPPAGTLVSANRFCSSLPCSDLSLGAVQQCASACDDFSTLHSYASTQSFSHFLDNRVEQLVASDAATAGHKMPVCCENNNISTCYETVDSATHATYQSVAEPVQVSALADYALIDLLNMSDDALDVLLSGSVDFLSDNQLPCTAACSTPNANEIVVSMDARTCLADIPVCCSVVTSVTEAFDCYPLLLAADESTNMDIPSELYNESFDNIGEESFQPDYYESDDESDRSSVVMSSDYAPTSGECRTGKKISIKKPILEKLTVEGGTRRRRPWKSSSQISGPAVSSLVERTVVTSSSETNTQPAVVHNPSPAASDPVGPVLSIAEEVLEGEG